MSALYSFSDNSGARGVFGVFFDSSTPAASLACVVVEVNVGKHLHKPSDADVLRSTVYKNSSACKRYVSSSSPLPLTAYDAQLTAGSTECAASASS